MTTKKQLFIAPPQAIILMREVQADRVTSRAAAARRVPRASSERTNDGDARSDRQTEGNEIAVRAPMESPLQRHAGIVSRSSPPFSPAVSSRIPRAGAAARRPCVKASNATKLAWAPPKLVRRRARSTRASSATERLRVTRRARLTEGIIVNAPAARAVHLQNIRIVGMRAFDLAGWTDNHPDLVQCWACPRFVGIDGFTGESDYQGLQLCHTPGIPGSKPIVRATVRRVNVRPTNPTLHVSLWRARARRGTSSTRSTFSAEAVTASIKPWAAGSDTSPYGTARVTAGSSCPAAAEPSKARATTPYAATTCGGRARRTTLPGASRASAWRRLRAAGPRRDGLPVPRIPLDPLGVTRPSDVERGIAPGGSFAEEPLQPRRCCGRFSLKRRKDRTWLAPQSGARSRSPH